jgi:hypothetical protein
MTAAIVGATGEFGVDIFTQAQNLFTPGVEIFFEEKHQVFFSLVYEGEFGGGYTTNELLLRLGKAF